MAKPDDLPEDDAALFRAAVGPLRELKPPPEAQRKAPPAPLPRQFERDENEALAASKLSTGAESDADALSYRRPEVPARVLRRLRRGLYAVQDEIDLHQLLAAQAEEVLRLFLNDARSHDRRCVRIIHGKGLHSKGDGPVLKPLVDRMLSRRGDVLAYTSAPPAQGGSGAVLVLLATRQ